MKSLTQTIWDEWSGVQNNKSALSEIAGMIGGLVYKVEGNSYVFSTTRLYAIRRLMRLWNECGSLKDPIRLLGANTRANAVFAIDVQSAQKIFAVTDNLPKRIRDWDWVRGLFGTCGALYMPRFGYYLTMHPPLGMGSAERMQAILRSCSFTIALRKRNTYRELTIKDQQQIMTFLSRIGLAKTALGLEETAIYRSLRNKANKLVNCDAANINKSLAASNKHMKLITYIEENGLSESLPMPLSELIEIRKKNPTMTLKELGAAMKKPISKSAIEYRWHKLETMIQQNKVDDANVLGKIRC